MMSEGATTPRSSADGGATIVLSGGRLHRWLVGVDGAITMLGPREPPSCAGQTPYEPPSDPPIPADAKWLDCRGCRLVAGWVNAHTHIYSGLVPLGMPPPEPPPENFLQILERIWWRLDRALDAEMLAASARLYAAEALLSGTSTLIDHHESPQLIEGSLDVLADACQQLGMRAVLCYGATERNGGRDEARRGLAECRRFIERNTRPLVRGMIGLHASFTVSDDTIREAARLGEELDVPLHIHLAEAADDVDDARRRGYPGPLERLRDLGALRPGSILAHGVHLDAEQTALASASGCWIVQNPRSNRGNGVGYPRHASSIERAALGTDGYPADVEAETEALREEATAYGDSLDSALQRVERGAQIAAERFGLPLSPLQLGGAVDVAVRGREGEALQHLVVGGRVAVQFGKLVTGEIEAIRDEARQAAGRLWARMAEL